MSMKVDVDVVGLLPMKRQVQLLAMSSKRRRRLMNKVAKKVISQSKKRVREQKDLNGQPFKDRAKKRSSNRRKMLSRLVKQLKVIKLDDHTGTVGFYNQKVGAIAADQQYGKTTTVSSKSFSTRSKESYNKPATRKQAKALLDAGFKVKRASGKGKKKPSLKYITNTYTQGQAGSTLSKLREWSGEKAKTSWVTRIPARSFLGATRKEITQYIDQIYVEMNQEMKRHGTR